MICRLISRISRAADRSCRWGALIFLIAMVILIVFQVIARYIFQAVPAWTAEGARYCMVWGGLLGATMSFRADRDPKLVKAPKTGPRLWLATAAFLRATAVILFLGPVLYHCDRFLIRHWHRSMAALEISTVWVTAAVPLSVIVIFIHLMARIVEHGSERETLAPPPS